MRTLTGILNMSNQVIIYSSSMLQPVKLTNLKKLQELWSAF